MQEERRCRSSYFLTLTYENPPMSHNNFMTLNKRDVQLYFKRLRKLNPPGLKYYAVGEYGGKTRRPHYHALVYNATLQSLQEAWTLAGTSLGHIHTGTVEGASIGYSLKYISKPTIIPLHRNDDRVPEFALMSKGLGSGYVNLKTQKWHLLDPENRMYLTLTDGRKVSMPRYYKDRIYTTERQAINYFLAQKELKDDGFTESERAAAYLQAFNKMKKAAHKTKI
uniref:Replication-associated protein n=1 Tax=Cressdnaviricota sp. TaxID=2748378 RepID=A0A6M3YPG5_9VIRU|nr:MAG: replication-associated protein [Cressdnaviricota sp.]